MAEQKAGGYTLDVADDIAGNPAVVMQDECHCDNPVVPQTEMTNVVVQKAGGYTFDVADDIAGNPAVVAQKAGGYTLDVGDDIAGNPAVVMQDECHCDNPVVPQTEMTNEVSQTGGDNPYNFVIDPLTGEEKYIFDKEGRDLLKSLVEKFIELNQEDDEDMEGGGDDCECCVEGICLDSQGPGECCGNKKNMEGGADCDCINSVTGECDCNCDGKSYCSCCLNAQCTCDCCDYIGDDFGGGGAELPEAHDGFDGYFGDDMMERNFGCEQPDWGAKCT